MGLYTISYSAAHVVAPFLGTTIIAAYGFATLWWAMGVMAVVTAAGFMWVIGVLEREKQETLSAAVSDVPGFTTG